MSIEALIVSGFVAGVGFSSLVAGLMSSYYAIARGCDGV